MGIMPSNPELGLASMYRVIKKSGAERVSDDAADELRKVLEDVAEKIVSDVTTARSFIAVRQELRKAPGLSIGTPLVRSADLGRNGGFEETFQKAQKI